MCIVNIYVSVCIKWTCFVYYVCVEPDDASNESEITAATNRTIFDDK